MSYPSKFVEFFGPCTWKTLHSIAFNYSTDPFHPTPQEQKAATDLFGSLAQLLPCEKCRSHYKAYLNKHPVDADSREALSQWVYDLHSDVNRRRHVDNVSYTEVKNDYAGWDDNKMHTFMKMEPQRRLRALADPHFGRKVQGQGAKELMMGPGNMNTDKIVGVGVIGAVVAGLVYYATRENNRKESK